MDAAGETIHPTECICFPRSGHHLLVSLLKAYFGEESLGYSELYGEPHRRIELDPSVRFQKNHDLQLGTRVCDDRRYVVQVRYPLDSLVSWFRWECEHRGLSDTPDAWMTFAIQNTSLWLRFYRKWVLDHVPGRLVVNYADLLDRPEAALGGVVEHLTGAPADADRIGRACAGEVIRQRHSYRGYKYYGESFFTMLKGFYAAAPGVDTEADRLAIPGGTGEGGGDDDRARELVEALREAGRHVQRLGDRLQHALGGEAPALGGIDRASDEAA